MKVKVRGLVAVLLLALASVATGQERFIRDDAGDTAHQSIDAEGLPIFGLADAYGRLWVNIASGTSGVQTEDVAASGGEVGVYCLAVQQDVLADSVSATGDFASLKVDALGALYIQGPFARDAAAGATAYGLQVLGVRTDTRASLGGTTGDWVPIQFTANGDARTKDDDLNTAFGTATTAAVDGDAAGSAVAHLRGINKKLAAGGIGVTETSAAAIAADLNELTAAPVAKVPVFLAAVIVGTPGTPLVLAADGTFFRTATLQAGRAAAANASLISIGGNTAYTSQRATELAPGETWTITAPAGTKYDLNDFYIDGVNTDDAVRIVYTAP